MNNRPWQNGFLAGRLSKPLEACPYWGFEVWEWISGYVDGRAVSSPITADSRRAAWIPKIITGRTLQ